MGAEVVESDTFAYPLMAQVVAGVPSAEVGIERVFSVVGTC